MFAKEGAVVVEQGDEPRLAGPVAQRPEAVHRRDGHELVGGVRDGVAQHGHRSGAGSRGGCPEGVDPAERLDDRGGSPDRGQGSGDSEVVAGRHGVPATPREAGGPGWVWAAHECNRRVSGAL